jgi:hypothetical protein
MISRFHVDTLPDMCIFVSNDNTPTVLNQLTTELVMQKIGLTVQEASRPENLNRSPNWIRHGIRLGKIQAERKGNMNIIPPDEVERVKANMPTISRKEILG